MIRRYELTDEEWDQLRHLFPTQTMGRPRKDPRLMFNAILWIARSGSSWRDLPERYGSWKTVYSRFCKWRDDGTLLTVFKKLNAEADLEYLSIDSTIIRAHQANAGAKKTQ
jgi:transposase